MADLDFDLGCWSGRSTRPDRVPFRRSWPLLDFRKWGIPCFCAWWIGGPGGRRSGGAHPANFGKAAEYISRSGDNLSKILRAEGLYSAGARRRGCQVQPGAPHRQRAAGRGGLFGLPAAGVPADVCRVFHPRAGRDAELLSPDAGQPGDRIFVEITEFLQKK